MCLFSEQNPTFLYIHILNFISLDVKILLSLGRNDHMTACHIATPPILFKRSEKSLLIYLLSTLSLSRIRNILYPIYSTSQVEFWDYVPSLNYETEFTDTASKNSKETPINLEDLLKTKQEALTR